MAVHRYAVYLGGDSSAPRDYATNSLWFNHTAPGEILPADLESLADDLIDVYQAGWCAGMGAREIRVKVYEVGPPPQYPVAEVVQDEGTFPASSGPREVALCLSYRSDGVPHARHRGRIFLPVYCHQAQPSTVRPNSTIMAAALAMAQGFADLGGVDVDWSTRSQTAGTVAAIQAAWVDDEWDTVRSRGLRPTTRQDLSLSE
jgi:hypothetical protein